MSSRAKRKRLRREQEAPPYVCPGCYAINNEPHAGYCPDESIERAEQDRIDRRDFENDLYEDSPESE